MKTNKRRMDAIERALNQASPGGWIVVYHDEHAAPGERYWIDEQSNFYLTDEQYAELANIHPRIVLFDYVDMSGIEQ